MRLEQPVGGVYGDLLGLLQTLSAFYFISQRGFNVQDVAFCTAKFAERLIELVWWSVVLIVRLD